MSSPGKGAATSGAVPPDRGVDRPARLWLFALSAGLIAGLLSWLGGEALQGWFVGPEARGPMGDQERAAAIAARQAAETKNAALATGLRGGALGLVLGLAGGLARGSVKAGAAVGLMGLVAGAIVGLGATLAMMPGYFLFVTRHPLSDDLIIPLLIHIGLWSPLGALGGLAFGLGLRGRSLGAWALVGGFLGAIFGAIIYELAGALAFPLALTTRPVSVTWGSRLMSHVLVAVFTTAGAAALCQKRLGQVRAAEAAGGRSL